jgi:hypothetical protein
MRQAAIPQSNAPFRRLWIAQCEKVVGEISASTGVLQWFYSPYAFLTVDDIEGTGCVAQAAIKAAVWVAKGKVAEIRMVVFGAGTAGTGISLNAWQHD